MLLFEKNTTTTLAIAEHELISKSIVQKWDEVSKMTTKFL